MPTPLETIMQAGSKLWLDSVDPDEVTKARELGLTGATSNPIIVSDIIKTGRFDDNIAQLAEMGQENEQIAWSLTDNLVRNAQQVFEPIWRETNGNDGYVSFELDPLLEDTDLGPSIEERTRQYIELGKRWSQGQLNRMIKVPATQAGIGALEELAAAGVTLNVTLIFSERQYLAARDAIWRGAQRRADLSGFKSVYSIFVSRLDVYTDKAVSELSDDAQGQVGIVNAKRIWRKNRDFWKQQRATHDKLVLDQEMIFASTGTKKPEDPKDKYVAAFTGSDIMTNPPATNETVQTGGKTYHSAIEQMPVEGVLNEIDRKVDFDKLEQDLLEEGLMKFANPQKELLELVAEKRKALAGA